MKRHAPLIILIIVALGVLWVLDSRREKKIDWTPSYNRTDRIPYGTYVLSEVLPQIFPRQKISYVNESPYLMGAKPYKELSNFIFVCDRLHTEKEYDLSKLVSFVQEGHSVFIAANNFDRHLLDTLGLRVGERVLGQPSEPYHFISASLQNQDTGVTFSVPVRGMSYSYFSSFDSASHEALGKLKVKDVYFLRVPFGKGAFYLHTLPEVFANYNMVRHDIYPLASLSLAQLDLQPVYWNDYYSLNNKRNGSLLRFLMSSEALMWAWYLLAFGTVLFILFEGKRKQRIQPVILPLANTTLEFAQTIGRLFYNQHDHRNIARKRILYFYETLRSRLYLRREGPDSAFFERFAQKAGISNEEATSFFRKLDSIERSHTIVESDLIRLANDIDEIYVRLGLRKTAAETLISSKTNRI
jgi:hypothetical protein